MGRRIIFVTGGARSGKSRFALRDASAMEGKKAFIATATAGDDEMAQRIARHKKERGPDWDTFEEPLRIGELLRAIEPKYDIILLDCLTLWLSNVMTAGLDAESAIAVLAETLASLRSARITVVSNEVGAGIVPDNELARCFRDAAGGLNQQVAAIADEAYLTVAGIAIKIKGADE